VSLPLRFDDQARDDITHAVAWYEARRTGLGVQFLSEVLRCVDFIARHPGGFQRVHGGFRQAPLGRFPYVIIYVLFKDAIVVFRVFHASQDPRKKFRSKRR